MRLLLAVVVAVLAPASVLAQPVSRWCTTEFYSMNKANNEVATAQKALTEANNQYNQAWSELQKWVNYSPIGPDGSPTPEALAFLQAHALYRETQIRLKVAQDAFQDAMADKREAQALAASCPASRRRGQGSWGPQ